METAFRTIRFAIGILLMLPMLWAASCSIVAHSAADAVSEAAEASNSPEAIKEAKARELRRHNEEINREASYRGGYYDDDY